MTLAENKKALVAAHRAGDQEAMRSLSQERQKLKRKRVRQCEWPGCGVAIIFNAWNPHSRGRFCRMHWIANRWHTHSLAAICILCLLCAFTNRPPIAAKLQTIKALLVPVGPPAPQIQRLAFVSWTPVTNAIWYRVYYSQDPEHLSDWVQTTNTSYTFTNGMPNGGTEYFAVSCAVLAPDGSNWIESNQSVITSYSWPWQAVGVTIITAQPVWSVDQGFTWENIGAPLVWTNPAIPAMLLKWSISATNY